MSLMHWQRRLGSIPALTAFRASFAVMIAAGCVEAARRPADVKKRSIGSQSLQSMADAVFHQMVVAWKSTTSSVYGQDLRKQRPGATDMDCLRSMHIIDEYRYQLKKEKKNESIKLFF
jgi:hypothetical protein